MSRDLFAAVPTTARLWGAVLLTLIVPTVDKTVGVGLLLPGTTLYGDCGYSDGPYCTPNTYLPGTYLPGKESDYLSQPQLRVLIWGAALALVAVAALRRTAQTQRVARLATLLLGGALTYALAERSPAAVIAVTLALMLAVPPAWRRIAPVPSALPPVFGSGRSGR